MKTNFNFSKMRCKKRYWMTEISIWKWFMPLIDAFNRLLPKHAVATGALYNLRKSNLMLGKFEEDSEPNGPN
jgi:hypothetical protein